MHSNQQMPNASVQPVIANLAVDRTIRRKGVGAKILRECERVVKGARAAHVRQCMCLDPPVRCIASHIHTHPLC